MNLPFQRIAFIFFLSFGVFYLSADFFLNQTQLQNIQTLTIIHATFDMPFFFSAGMYALASLKLWIEKIFPLPFLSAFFWLLAITFTLYLLSINVDFKSLV